MIKLLTSNYHHNSHNYNYYNSPRRCDKYFLQENVQNTNRENDNEKPWGHDDVDKGCCYTGETEERHSVYGHDEFLETIACKIETK